MHVHPRLNWRLPKHRLLIPKVVAQKHCRVGGTRPSTSRTCTTAWRWWWKVSGDAASARRTLWHSQSSCQTAANKHCWRATFLRHTGSRYSVSNEIRRRRIILPKMLPSSIWHTSSTSRLCDASVSPHDHASSSHSNSVLADNIAHIENLAKCQSSAVHEYRMEAKPCPSNS